MRVAGSVCFSLAATCSNVYCCAVKKPDTACTANSVAKTMDDGRSTIDELFERIRMRAAAGEDGSEKLARIGAFGLRELLRRAGCDDAASFFAAFRPQVDDVVCRFEHTEV